MFKLLPKRPRKTKEGYIICRNCRSFYFQGLWQGRSNQRVNSKVEKNCQLVLCPACQMVEEGKHEGELIIENIPNQEIEKVRRIIAVFGDKSFQKNPLERIISLEDAAKGMVRVLTTKNQMIGGLTEKLKKMYKLEFKIIYSKPDLISKIRLIFVRNL